MPLICLETLIKAPLQTVFDLSRSVDVHKTSMLHHKEEIVDGIKHGLMNEGDTVTWKARHLLKSRTLKVRITALQAPTFFADEMIKGDFKTMRHEHRFAAVPEGTLMTDRFYFESPYGLFGRFANYIFLTSYMTNLLRERNRVIKETAEGKIEKQRLHT